MSDLLSFLPQSLIALIGFILTIGFLVTIHEYGHFWVARRFGVKIEKFSIGFGRPLIKWYGKRDHTEFSIAWIPLGGYVKMYGENPTDSNTSSIVAADLSEASEKTLSDGGSFSDLPPHKRFLIAFAGPAVNLIFAVLALWWLFVSGIPAITPYVGTVEKNSPLYQQLYSGDKIIKVGDNPSVSLTDAVIRLVDNMGHRTTLTAIDNNGKEKTINLDLSNLPAGSELAINEALGFQWGVNEVGQYLPAVIEQVIINSPAERAGLQAGDTIISANEQAIRYWSDLVNIIQRSVEQPILLKFKRSGNVQTTELTPTKHPQNAELGYGGISGRFDNHLFDKYRMVKRYDLLSALPMAIKENYLQAKLLLKTLGRLIIGEASVKNMGGPLTIADYSGKSLQMGTTAYLNFLAAISLTLAVMNLLPIPILDGGHMLLCAIEMIRGKPLSERSGALLLRLGMSLMLTFMLFVISVDVWKYLFGF